VSFRLDQLDSISRVRPLTESESLELEREIRRAEGDRLPHRINRDLAREGVKRSGTHLPPRPDPRSRRVVAARLERGQDWHIELDCGHHVRRRLSALPHALICHDLPSPRRHDPLQPWRAAEGAARPHQRKGRARPPVVADAAPRLPLAGLHAPGTAGEVGLQRALVPVAARAARADLARVPDRPGGGAVGRARPTSSSREKRRSGSPSTPVAQGRPAPAGAAAVISKPDLVEFFRSNGRGPGRGWREWLTALHPGIANLVRTIAREMAAADSAAHLDSGGFKPCPHHALRHLRPLLVRSAEREVRRGPGQRLPATRRSGRLAGRPGLHRPRDLRRIEPAARDDGPARRRGRWEPSTSSSPRTRTASRATSRTRPPSTSG
jgi:hypothetical protein